MVSRRVLNSLQQGGATLIEFMVASVIGLMAIGIIGSVFVTSQSSAAERGKELLLLQQVYGTLQYLKQDIQRAGYAGDSRSPLRLQDSDDLVYISADAKTIAYAYLDDRQPPEQIRNVSLSWVSGELKVCDRPSSMVTKTVSAATSGCSAIFEPQQIIVTKFHVQQVSLASSGVSSAYLTISMAAALVGDPSVSHAFAINIKQRNWQ